MSRKFKIPKDPYEDGINIYKKGTITIEPGVTVLVGCNGSGKTTLLDFIKSDLNEKKIPVYDYNNLSDGGSYSLSESLFTGDIDLASNQMCSSEGENIMLNISKIASNFKKFIDTGKTGKYSDRLYSIFSDKEIETNTNERWILLDATDSGLSIDNIIEVKYLFKLILNDTDNIDKEIYIIVSANEYEMADGQPCFDVCNSRYVSIKSYNTYKQVILKSRAIKDNRYK